MKQTASKATITEADIRKLVDKLVQAQILLTPFAKFAERWNKDPINGLADELYGIHGGEPCGGACLRLSDCEAARKFLYDH
jgi:hypothetical protein